MILKSAAIFIIQNPHYNTESDSAGPNSNLGDFVMKFRNLFRPYAFWYMI